MWNVALTIEQELLQEIAKGQESLLATVRAGLMCVSIIAFAIFIAVKQR